jgi:hypothetical protein
VKMTLTEQATKEAYAKHVGDRLAWATRELASNILRIAAHGGKAHELPQQIIDFGEAYNAAGVFDRTGLLDVPSIVARALQDRDWRARSGDFPGRDPFRPRSREERAIEKIIQSALRVVASELVAQPTQESIADGQLYDGITAFNEARRR